MEQQLAKYFSGEASQSEIAEVLQCRVENSSDFLAYKRVWAGTHKSVPNSASLAAIIGKDGNETVVVEMRPSWYRYAASVAIVIGAALGFYFLSDTSDFEATAFTRMEELSDGTEVILYKNASMDVVSFEGTRKVKVDGRVYFDVEENPALPFVIETDEAIIEVLGTSFLVNAESLNTTEVVVESGVVAFSQNPNAKTGKITRIELRKGEKGLITPNAKGVIKQNNRDENYLAWADQELKFKKTELARVGDLLNDVYGYKIKFGKDILSKCQLSASYKRKSPEEIIRLVAETFDFSYVINEDKTVLISGEGCK